MNAVEADKTWSSFCSVFFEYFAVPVNDPFHVKRRNFNSLVGEYRDMRSPFPGNDLRTIR